MHDATLLFDHLIAADGPMLAIVRQVRMLMGSTDAPETPVTTLHISDIIAVIHKYLDMRISANELEEWAEVLSMNDWIAYADDEFNTIANTLFRLSTPEINVSLTVESVSDLLKGLTSVDEESN
jgi:hypothetical protein